MPCERSPIDLRGLARTQGSLKPLFYALQRLFEPLQIQCDASTTVYATVAAGMQGVGGNRYGESLRPFGADLNVRVFDRGHHILLPF